MLRGSVWERAGRLHSHPVYLSSPLYTYSFIIYYTLSIEQNSSILVYYSISSFFFPRSSPIFAFFKNLPFHKLSQNAQTGLVWEVSAPAPEEPVLLNGLTAFLHLSLSILSLAKIPTSHPCIYHYCINSFPSSSFSTNPILITGLTQKFPLSKYT